MPKLSPLRAHPLACALALATLALPAWPQAATTATAALPATSPASPTVTLQQLNVNAAASARKLKVARATQKNVEEALAEDYEAMQLLCRGKFDALESDQQRYAKAEARTNVIGSVLALLGSVTVYAPGKTVLMGLGVSSAGNGAVASGLTQFFSTRSAVDRSTLIGLKTQLALVLDRYDSIDAGADTRGDRRSALLARARGVCLGLEPEGAPAAEPPASAASGNAP